MVASGRQFDVFPNPSLPGRSVRPFVMVLQGNHLDDQPTRVVAPLVLDTALKPTSRMTPVFDIEGLRVVLSLTELAVFPARVLKGRIANFEDRREEIKNALDLLFGGV